MATDPKGRLVFMNYKEADLEEKNEHCRSEPSQLLSFLTEKKNDRIEVVTSGGRFQSHRHIVYRGALLCSGYTNYGSLHLTNESVYDREVQERFSSANVVLFVGDQSRLHSIFKGTKILRVLHKRYMVEENFTIAGVSTGGLCIPRRMISYFPADDSPDRAMDLMPGLGFLHNCIIDTCYSQQTRYEKLAYTVVENHDLVGIGLGADTALIVQNGHLGSCRGDGTIVIINALDTAYLKTNAQTPNRSFLIKNLKGRVLIDGCSVNLRDGR